jgi:hypothetical protein
MPALPRQQAADELGISPATLLRITRNGVGKIQQGGGRARKTLFDTETIRAARGSRDVSTQRLFEIVEQFDRGARALTLTSTLVREFQLLQDALAQFDVPQHRRAELVRFLAWRIVDCACEHLRIDERPDFATLMDITASR